MPDRLESSSLEFSRCTPWGSLFRRTLRGRFYLSALTQCSAPPAKAEREVREDVLGHILCPAAVLGDSAQSALGSLFHVRRDDLLPEIRTTFYLRVAPWSVTTQTNESPGLPGRFNNSSSLASATP